MFRFVPSVSFAPIFSAPHAALPSRVYVQLKSCCSSSVWRLRVARATSAVGVRASKRRPTWLFPSFLPSFRSVLSPFVRSFVLFRQRQQNAKEREREREERERASELTLLCVAAAAAAACRLPTSLSFRPSVFRSVCPLWQSACLSPRRRLRPCVLLRGGSTRAL